MPNWYYNTLTVTGIPEQVIEFEKYASRKRGKVLHEDAFSPYPRKFKRADKEHDKAQKAMLGQPPAERDPSAQLPPDGFNHGGYDWCVKHWGTKWGICEPKITESSPGRIVYEFDTVWNPPIPLVKTMSKKFPTLRFELYYEEPLMDFQGYYEVKNDTVLLDEIGSYRGGEGDETDEQPATELPPSDDVI